MKFNRSRLFGAAAAAAVAVLLSSCSAPEAETPDMSADLSAFASQELEFGSCEDFATTALETTVFDSFEAAECAWLDVPVDYDDPTGDTAQLAVTRIAAGGGDERIGSLVVNPGGPGGPGTIGAVAASAGLQETAIAERFDIVGFSPRGVGASTPTIDCISDEDADQNGMAFILGAVQGSWTADDTERYVDDCIAATGSEAFLASIGTDNVARDMDILRAVLGDEELTFLGQSYGTRLGAVYAEMFPERVRAMVLDGAQDPTLQTFDRKVTQYAGFQRSFDLMATSCAQSPDCVLGQDPEQAVDRFHDIMRPLIDAPITSTDGRLIDFNVAVGAVIGGLYTEADRAAVLKGIAEVQAGTGDTLLALSDRFAERGADGVWSNYLEANFAINCMDEQRRTPEEEEQLRSEIFAAAPFMDPGEAVEGARDGCEAWPGDTVLEYPYAQDIEGLPDTLTISITGDPTTPYQGGINLAETLGGSLLTVEGEQHTIATSGASDCVNDIVTSYLVNLEAPPADAMCTLA